MLSIYYEFQIHLACICVNSNEIKVNYEFEWMVNMKFEWSQLFVMYVCSCGMYIEFGCDMLTDFILLFCIWMLT